MGFTLSLILHNHQTNTKNLNTCVLQKSWYNNSTIYMCVGATYPQ